MKGIKSFIQLSLLITLKALNKNRGSCKAPLNETYDKGTMLDFLYGELGTNPGDEFIDMRIRLCRDLPHKEILDCDCVEPALEDEEESKPALVSFPNKEVSASAFEAMSTEEWKAYCEGND